MSYLILKDIPRYDCLVKASEAYPDLDIGATEAFLYLLKSGDEMQRILQAHFEQHGISQGRFLILMLLMHRHDGECFDSRTPADLAEQAQVTRATITGLLDTLEKDGFVQRTACIDDRRQVNVEITPAGEALMHTILPAHFRLIAKIFSSLDRTEQGQLVHILQKLSNPKNND